LTQDSSLIIQGLFNIQGQFLPPYSKEASQVQGAV